MTVPGAGGRSVVLTPGAAAVLVTEYAGGPDNPAVLINTGTDRAWVAGDSGVSPSSGVPVEGGTALPWAAPGQVWAVTDPAASGSITLVATTAVGAWTESPAVLASQVAAALSSNAGVNAAGIAAALASNNQLTATGVAAQIAQQGAPVVQKFGLVAADSAITYAQPYTSPVLDLGWYASLIVRIENLGSNVNGALCPVQITWTDDAAGANVVDEDHFLHVCTLNPASQLTLRIPTRARYATVTVTPTNTNPTYRAKVWASTTASPSSLLRARGATSSANGAAYLAPPLLYSSNGGTLPAGADGIGYVPPVAQSVRVVIDGSGAPAGSVVAELSAMVVDSANTVVLEHLATVSSVNPGGANEPVAQITVNVPFGVPMRLDVYNNDTAARAPTVRVFDVSNN